MDSLFNFYKSAGLNEYPNRCLHDESAERLQVSDYCCCEDPEGGKVVCTDFDIAWKDVGKEIEAQHVCAAENPQAGGLLVRLAWLPIEPGSPSWTTIAPASAEMELITKLRLNSMRARISHALGARALASPALSSTNEPQQYCLSSLVTFGCLAWTHDPIRRYSSAVCWIQPDCLALLRSAMTSLTADTLRDPIALAVAWLLGLSAKADLLFVQFEDDICTIERSTGHHSFGSRKGPEAEAANLRSFTAQATGIRASLAVSEKVTSQLRLDLRAVMAMLKGRSDGTRTEQSSLATTLMLEYAEAILQSCDIEEILIRELFVRVEAQLTAIFHLITQDDTKRSIQLAESSTALAADSRALAEAASRDAKAMKTLAVVTMVYLPPTAIATIFAMPFFDWNGNASGAVINHRFWMYWATAIPLTIATLFIWWIWIRRSDDFKIVVERIEKRFRAAQAGNKQFDAGKSTKEDTDLGDGAHRNDADVMATNPMANTKTSDSSGSALADRSPALFTPELLAEQLAVTPPRRRVDTQSEAGDSKHRDVVSGFQRSRTDDDRDQAVPAWRHRLLRRAAPSTSSAV